jgi:hypothetical protein
MIKTKKEKINPDWWSKILSATFLGYLFAIGCAGVFFKLCPDIPSHIRTQLAMWLVIPIWLSILSGCFFFKKGSHAWIVLISANLLIFGLFSILPDIVI